MRDPAALKAAAQPFRIRFANLDRDAGCPEGQTIFQAARRAGVRLVGACGGRGVCGSCMVRILSGEAEIAQAREPGAPQRAKEWVRACQALPRGDCIVDVAPRSLAPIVRVEVDGEDAMAISVDPSVRVRDFLLEPPTMAEPGADADRLLRALKAGAASRLDLTALQALPDLLRNNDWRAQALVRAGEVIGIRRRGRKTLGLAVDLGTTNCAGFLIDLETGTRLASLGIENPQSGFGADVVSRIDYAVREPGGDRELQQAAVTAISGLANDLCGSVASTTDDIAEIAVCGNTAMHHLLLGLPVSQLGRAPFVPAISESIDVRTRDLGLPAAAGAYLHLMPNIGGYVGGDHVAALLATEDQWADATALVMDVGTNTEISLAHRGTVTAVSCPSGPALEGGHISAGMRAAEGAIERVSVEAGRLALQVIGDDEPVGLCGSGVIDAVAAMIKTGLVDHSGRICAGRPEVREQDAHRRIALAEGVFFSQADVRAVQLAKAAIRAGIDLLLREAGLEESDIERVVIAGAFGAYIGLESAVAIGLLPALPLARFRQVGNAAGVGVRMALASVAKRERARQLAANCRYLELGSLSGFQKTFIGRIGFD